MIAEAYRQLLQEYVPRPIRNERAYQKMLRAVDKLMKQPQLTRAEGELLDVLVALIEQYESIQFPTPSNSPERMLAHLIESKGVSRAEVAAATGISSSTINAVLAGRGGINREKIPKLAEFFGVSASVFASTAASLRRGGLPDGRESRKPEAAGKKRS